MDKLILAVVILIAAWLDVDLTSLMPELPEAQRETITAALPTAAPVGVGEWKYFSGSGVSGKYEGYSLDATSDSGYSWEAAPTLRMRCGIGNDGYDDVFITTPFLLHGGDSTAGVNWRLASQRAPTLETWYSNEESDSTVFATAAFTQALSGAAGTLFVEFVSAYNNDTNSATFDVTGAVGVASALSCYP